MELYISNSGQEPIYAQITRQIKAKILNGELQQGDALPSIRLLAKELRISVITTNARMRTWRPMVLLPPCRGAAALLRRKTRLYTGRKA